MAPPRTRWPIYYLWLLMCSAAIYRYTVSVAGLHVFPENVALALTLPVVVLAVQRGWLEWQWPSATWLFLGWLLTALCASLFNAPQTTHSFILWNKLCMVAATY